MIHTQSDHLVECMSQFVSLFIGKLFQKGVLVEREIVYKPAKAVTMEIVMKI